MSSRVHNFDGLSEKEIAELIDKAIYEVSNNANNRDTDLINNNPELKEAWDQIKTIRALTSPITPSGRNVAQPEWYKLFMDISEADDDINPALKEAWNQYYNLKKQAEDGRANK